MNIHEKNISKSIDLNIIGTANIVKICEQYKIKLIYFSTAYVYEGTKGNYKEDDPIGLTVDARKKAGSLTSTVPNKKSSFFYSLK